MEKMKVRELPDWPPVTGGARRPGADFPDAGEAVVNELFPVRDRTVTFRAIFGGDTHSYHYKAESRKIAQQIHSAIKENPGKTVAEFGELEIKV